MNQLTKEDSNMITRVIPKKEVQKILKQLRELPVMDVQKDHSGYSVTLKFSVNGQDKGALMFRAMIGTRGYLCRFDSNLFE